MNRALRKALFLSLLACQTAVTVCGPCLHELPGLSHELSISSKAKVPPDGSRPLDHKADHCLICHYLTQGQVSVEVVSLAVVPLVFELAAVERPALLSSSCPSLAHSRAPPANIA